jgi:hypothetical protein
MVNPGHHAFRRGLELADRLLANRWLQAVLFAAAFLAVWLAGMKSAHALAA